ncbi:MAG: hypothetical protein NTZ97_02925 [Candidatus Moranbacteria bacterium]|nr:hypothetical protein [Candidatus Moranbacteria bacterium]
MTPEGFEKVKTLKEFVPRNTKVIICGTGARHIDVANALGLIPTRFTSVVGSADSLEITEDKKEIVVLANGLGVPSEMYTTLEDESASLPALIFDLPDDAVICAGRPALIMLGKKDAKSGAVYQITPKGIEFEITELS